MDDLARAHHLVPEAKDILSGGSKNALLKAKLTARAIALLDKTAAGQRPIRLLGVSLQGLTDDERPPSPVPSRIEPATTHGPVQLSLPFQPVDPAPSPMPRSLHPHQVE